MEMLSKIHQITRSKTVLEPKKPITTARLKLVAPVTMSTSQDEIKNAGKDGPIPTNEEILLNGPTGNTPQKSERDGETQSKETATNSNQPAMEERSLETADRKNVDSQQTAWSPERGDSCKTNVNLSETVYAYTKNEPLIENNESAQNEPKGSAKCGEILVPHSKYANSLNDSCINSKIENPNSECSHQPSAVDGIESDAHIVDGSNEEKTGNNISVDTVKCAEELLRLHSSSTGDTVCADEVRTKEPPQNQINSLQTNLKSPTVGSVQHLYEIDESLKVTRKHNEIVTEFSNYAINHSHLFEKAATTDPNDNHKSHKKNEDPITNSGVDNNCHVDVAKIGETGQYTHLKKMALRHHRFATCDTTEECTENLNCKQSIRKQSCLEQPLQVNLIEPQTTESYEIPRTVAKTDTKNVEAIANGRTVLSISTGTATTTGSTRVSENNENERGIGTKPKQAAAKQLIESDKSTTVERPSQHSVHQQSNVLINNNRRGNDNFSYPSLVTETSVPKRPTSVTNATNPLCQIKGITHSPYNSTPSPLISSKSPVFVSSTSNFRSSAAARMGIMLPVMNRNYGYFEPEPWPCRSSLPIYCLKCRSKTDTKDSYKTLTVKGQPIMKGYCVTCDRKKCSFIKKSQYY